MINLLIYFITGFLGGIASGLFGVGGGLVFVPLMVVLLRFDIHLAIGTSLAAVVPTALMAVFKHGSAQMIDWKTAACLALFAVAGAWVGSHISLRLDALVLRKVYAVFLLGLSLKLFFQK